MTSLEDRLRAALQFDVAVPDLVGSVRRRAERRRRRRRTAAAVAAALAVAAAVGLGTLAPDDPRRPPSPAPAPTPTANPGPTAGVVDVAAGERGVLVLAEGRVWRDDGSGWEVLHDFDSDDFQYLVMAPDGVNGWAWGKRLWSTHDGGRTWQRTNPPADPMYGYHVWPTSTYVWVQTRDHENREQYFRAALGADEWTPVDLPEGSLVSSEHAVAVLGYVGEDLSSPLLRVSVDDATTWRDLPLPCSGENQIYPAGAAFFVLCSQGAVANAYRTEDLATWKAFGSVKGAVSDVEVVGPSLLVVGAPSVLVGADGPRQVVTDLGEGAWDVATVGSTSYLASQDGRLLVSRDGGLTWSAQ